MNNTCIKNLLLREIILDRSPSFRWSVLVRALDSLNQPIRSIAEIGVYKGGLSKFLRQCFPTTDLYLIDPWELPTFYQKSEGPVTLKKEKMEKAFQEVQEYFQKDPHAHILKMTSKEACSLVPNSLDLVFIDGNHDYEFVKEDIELWLPKVRSGGILAGHDYEVIAKDFPGVKQAVDEFFGNSISIKEDKVWLFTK